MTGVLQRWAQWLHEQTAWAAHCSSHSPCCRMAETVRLLPTAQISNARRDPECIRVGAHTFVKGELLTFGHGGEIQIGEWCFVGEGSRIWSADRIQIGNRVLISHNVNIFDNDTHPIDDPVARHRQFVEIVTTGQPHSIDLNEQPVLIEDDVLIGCQSIILPGVVIGAGAVVGAGSVVTRSVSPFTVVAGNPARVIRIIERKVKA